MRIVVTGGLGHIGSRLIRHLPETFENPEVVIVDDLSTQRYCSLFELPRTARYRFVEADITTVELDPLLRGADAVVHLAAITNAEGSFDQKDKVAKVNAEGTQRVADTCVRAGCPLVFFSTTSVYGPQDEVVDEDCPESVLRPQSPYAQSKLSAERYLQSRGTALRWVAFRFGTIFGTSVGMRFHTAINKFCWQAAMGQPLTVWRTALNQKRPYLDLTDAVAAIEFVLARQLFDRRIYNVVTTNTTVQEILDLISRVVPDHLVKYVDTPIMNQLSYSVSPARLINLGFRYEGNLEQGIRSTLSWLESGRLR
ncbi:MAG: SDR family oxidoreductase [Nitrospirae bacterium]|nr:SDR family oxidoreductase [Nitrospirota bacterium]